jgi:twinkle protein
VFFVAHPKQLQRKQDGTFPVPTLYDISGSANWVNKADVGIVVHRDDEKGAVDVFVRKVRRKEIGIAGGYQTFLYDVARGTYRDVPTDEFEEARNR